MIRFNKSLIRQLLKSKQTKYFIFAYLGISFAIIIHAYLQYYFDVLNGSSENTFFDYIWCGYTTASTTGYGDISSVSIEARIATIVIMYHIVIGLFTWFIGSIIESFLTYKERRLKGMHDSNQKNGIIIFNYPGEEKLATLINEFRKIHSDIPVCIIDPLMEQLPMDIVELKNIHFVSKKVISQEAIKSASVKEAKWIFIFPTNQDDSDSDALTYAIYQNLQNIKFINEEIRIIPWVVNPRNRHLFKRSKASMVMGDLQVKLMVQEATDKYVSKAIDVLLKNTVNANPVTINTHALKGMDWGKLQYGLWKYNENREESNTINLLALIKNEQVFWNPPNSTIIDHEDSILVASFPGFNWNDVEKELIKNNQ